MRERLDQLLQLHTMCLQELHQLQANVENYLESSGRMIDMLRNNWCEVERGNGLALMIYDNFLTSITNVMNYSRKFNIQLQLNHPQKTAGEDATGPDSMYDIFCQQQQQREEEGDCAQHVTASLGECVSDETTTECMAQFGSLEISRTQQNVRPAKEACAAESYKEREDFIYPKLKLTRIYEKYSTLQLNVAYIKNLDQLTFYAIDPLSDCVKGVSEVSQCLDLHQYQSLPPAQEVFGLVLDKRILRAVRSAKVLYDQEEDEEIWPCYLLDYGEVVNLRLSDIKYKLTDEQKMTPACALLCRLKGNETTMKAKLQEMVHKECSLQIVDISDNMLTVQLAQALPPNDNEQLEFKNKAINKTINNNVYNTNLKDIKANVTFNSSTSTTASSSMIKADALPNKTLRSCLKKDTNPFRQPLSADNLTPEELDMLNEEPLNTSNVMKAVLGYDPQDDKRICRFYDAKTGACFKGSNCKQEHVPLHPEGWTKDVLPAVSIVDNRTPTILYPKGTLLNVTPTYIGQIGTFYAQINDPHHHTSPLVWIDEDIPPWQRLERPPHVFELILARYEDGNWYRAKVLTHDDDYRKFKVFYVDYGNHQIVDMRSMAKCDYSKAHQPFQATFCRLAYLKELDITAEKRKAGIEMLCDILLNKSVDVKVISHYEDLIISFVGEQNLTIKSKLVHGGYMKPF